MSLLDDKALVANVTGTGKPLVTNLKAKNGQWFDAESPIQACSVDLHIGKIFIPGKSGKEEGSQDSPLDLHTLECGQTAVVSTLEDLCLPHDIAAIGFPPNRISVQGILMTNPGHIDPGYSGPMRFTIINMGKTHFVLRREDPIVTLLFMKLPQPVQKDWGQRRNGATGKLPTQTDLDRLSADFLDVGERAKTAAKLEVDNAGLKLKAREVFVGLIGGIISAIALAFILWLSGVQDLKVKVAELEKSLSVTKVEQKITDIDKRLAAVEQSKISNSGSSTSDSNGGKQK
jgi:deoxycytidine triphosphate deaminase